LVLFSARLPLVRRGGRWADAVAGAADVSQGRVVEFLDAGLQRGIQPTLQAASRARRTPVGAGVATRGEPEGGLRGAHHVAGVDLGRVLQKAQAASPV
jgi:hypothetical protein